MFVGFEPASNSREFTYGSNVILKKLSSHYSFFADENSRGLVQTVKFGGNWGTVCFYVCIPASAF